MDVEANFLDLEREAKNDDLVAPPDDVQSRLRFQGQAREPAYSDVTSKSSAILEINPDSKLHGSNRETVQVAFVKSKSITKILYFNLHFRWSFSSRILVQETNLLFWLENFLLLQPMMVLAFPTQAPRLF